MNICREDKFMKYVTMNYHKLTTNPESTSIEHVESPTMVKENNVPKNLELSDIKTLYGELIYSWPVEPEGFEEEYFGDEPFSEEEYYEALENVECGWGMTSIVCGIETISGEFIDTREHPFELRIETPTETLHEYDNKEELLNALDSHAIASSLDAIGNNSQQL